MKAPTLLAVVAAAASAFHVIANPLDDYVWTPDENYKWVL